MQQEPTQQDISITYETIFEILRLEKGRDDIQRLPSNFFDSVVAYMREKQHLIDESKIKQDLFSAAERDKLSSELANIKRILKELYERREKKIISMALNKSRTSSSIIDPSSLLADEKEMFQRFVSLLDIFREGVIYNVMSLKQPYIKEACVPSKENSKPEKEEIKKDTKLVRFLYPVPKFVGKELEQYGPFEEEEMSTLPSEIAELLINKGRAEEITDN